MIGKDFPFSKPRRCKLKMAIPSAHTFHFHLFPSLLCLINLNSLIPLKISVIFTLNHKYISLYAMDAHVGLEHLQHRDVESGSHSWQEIPFKI